MLRRFKLFFIGMIMGTIVVIWAFGDRLNLFTSWLPNERVLLRLQQTEMKQTKKAKCQMDCLGINKTHIDALIQEGDIDFKNSDTQNDPLIYIVNHSTKDLGEFQLTFAAADSTSTIISAQKNLITKNCECED
ncbi:MAG: hypothetical protein AAF487_02425 [Bacteroidota bacterium]